MTEVQAARSADPRLMRRALGACAIGNATEWFDYSTYGFLAIILGSVFFPSEDPTISLLSSFAVFGVAFAIRPLGGLVFGPLGDKLGRQRILAFTIILMAAATFTVGLLPGYATIGIWAPILLVFLRLVQGFSAGGEYGGAATFMAEYAPDDRRGFWTSWLEFGSLTGYFMGAGLVTLLTVGLSDAAMSSWGWRVPFLLGGPLGVVGLYLRLKLEDTPNFKALEEAGEVEETPLRDTFTHAWRPMLLLLGIMIIGHIGNYVLLAYMVNYLQNTMNVGGTTALLITFIAIVFMLAVIWRVGTLSDRFGRKTVLTAACGGFIVFSYPAFWLISLGNWPTTMLGMLILALCQVLILGTIPSTLPALFPTEVRYTGFAISYNIAAAAFGGTAAFVAGYLVSATGSNYAPAFYLMGAAVISLIPILLSPETAKQPLRSGFESPSEASPSEAS